MVPATVLIIDDDESLRDTVQVLLEREGFRVLSAADGTAGFNEAVTARPDLLIVDLRIPGMSGIELHTHILEKSPAMKNKIIFITGDVMGADIKEFLVKNNLTYFAKPFDIEALKAKINRLMLSLPLSNDSA